MEPIELKVIGLGEARFQPINLNTLSEVEQKVANTPLEDRAKMFIDFLIADSMTYPKLSYEEIVILETSTRTEILQVIITLLALENWLDELASTQISEVAIYEAHHARMEKVTSDFGEIFENMALHLNTASKNIAPYLIQAGFWIAPTTSFSLLGTIQTLVQRKDVTVEKIQECIISYYQQNNWAILKQVVQRWKNNQEYLKRMPIIEEALEAHVQGKYWLLIPALLSQIEGIVTSIQGRDNGKIRRIYAEWIEMVVDTHLPDYLRESYKDALIH